MNRVVTIQLLKLIKNAKRPENLNEVGELGSRMFMHRAPANKPITLLIWLCNLAEPNWERHGVERKIKGMPHHGRRV